MELFSFGAYILRGIGNIFLHVESMKSFPYKVIISETSMNSYLMDHLRAGIHLCTPHSTQLRVSYLVSSKHIFQ